MTSTTPDSPASPEDIAKTWLARITATVKSGEKWRRRGDKIIRIYRAKGASETEVSESARFNVFWSNVETLAPATYSRRPKAEVFRRFHDQDPVARVAGLILERGLQYEIDCKNDLHLTLKANVKDRLLPGLGACWVRYEPSFGEKDQLLPSTEEGQAPTMQKVKTIEDEFTAVDYVFWKDLVVSPARTWSDVRWVARFVPFSKDTFIKRFSASMKQFSREAEDVPANVDPEDPMDSTTGTPPAREESTDSSVKRVAVYEIWDKEGRQLLWVSPDADTPLDIREDVANLEDFFPCPPPLLATTTTDQLEPVPDYVYYQEQIRELDSVTRRINILVGSLRLIGVYDANNTELQGLLRGGTDNRMVPVNSWAAFADRGGLKSAIDFVPLDQVYNILKGLYEARDQLKQSVYEITGMADIVRGATVASETLGAQQIKAKFANLRLSSRQQQVAEYVTGILRIKAELMCRHYQPETLIRISSIEQLPEVQADLKQLALQRQQQQIQQQQAMLAQQNPGQPAPPPPQLPPPPPIEDPLQSPLVQKALALLKNERIRKYRIEVASDSMVELDEADERQRRTDFMASVSNFFNGMKNVTAVGPEMVPVALEMLKFVVRGFSVGRVLESTIESAIFKIQARLDQPQPPQPPEALQVAKLKEEGETMRMKMKLEADAAQAAQERQAEDRQAHLDRQHAAVTDHLQRLYDGQQASADRFTASQQTAQEASQQASAQNFKALEGVLKQILTAVTDESDDAKEEAQFTALGQALQKVEGALQELLTSIRAPRKRVPVYGADGELTHVSDELA